MNAPLSLGSPVTALSGVGPKKAESFAKLGITVLGDFLRHFPRDYEDLRNAKQICDVQDGEKVLIEAALMLKRPGRGFGRKRTLHLMAADRTGSMEVIFFAAGFLDKQFQVGRTYRFFGKAKVENGKVVLFHPAWHAADSESDSGIQPVYPLSKGLTQKDLRRGTREALMHLGELEDPFPSDITRRANLCPQDFAIRNLHFPEGEDAFRMARYRIIFEEFFSLRAALLLSADRFGRGRQGVSFSSGSSRPFLASLPYALTGAQQQALAQIERDMDSSRAMNRLLQGDVGSGKTAVAAAALFKAVKAGYQGAFMAPTEILAEQHFRNLSRDYARFGFTVDLLTGSLSAAEKKAVLTRLASGQTDVVVGTHAILSDNVRFSNLGLVVTDEQHRFGVNQRQLLTKKGENPDVLVMTATPIPRTLAIVLYSDLDISVIDELPPGRRPIETRQYDASTRKSAYRLLLSEIEKGHQAYIVAPFIEESEAIDGHSAEGLYDDFRKAYPQVSCGLLHGQMAQNEKDAVMADFAAGRISVLISTVVIEVGIDVANASVMLIENAERFGLAQMHQLRGRVGRGPQQSYCLIVNEDDAPVAVERARILCETTDGFVIAEKDLSIRGPGEFFGYRQHGLPQLRFADPVRHAKVLETAGEMAKELIASDPKLESPENAAFAEYLRRTFAEDVHLVL